ncbi:hypothetical protein NG791_09830 [Laspinema sp. D1]|uniref:hypothetical protein n=1 Tax=Laspinema palackyanum TaxID=3231601 RepID=UPI00346E1C0E|nr:hypothetical protein [Laspinema sp. D2b]
MARGGLGWGSSWAIAFLTSGPLPLARGGLGWGSSWAIAFLTSGPLTSGPLTLARGGLGWGSSWAIATSHTLNGLSACMEADPTSFFVTCGKRSYPIGNRPCTRNLHPLIALEARSPHQKNPTLTLPLPRGGDRK